MTYCPSVPKFINATKCHLLSLVTDATVQGDGQGMVEQVGGISTFILLIVCLTLEDALRAVQTG